MAVLACRLTWLYRTQSIIVVSPGIIVLHTNHNTLVQQTNGVQSLKLFLQQLIEPLISLCFVNRSFVIRYHQ